MSEDAGPIEQRRNQRCRAEHDRVEADGGYQVEDRSPPVERRESTPKGIGRGPHVLLFRRRRDSGRAGAATGPPRTGWGAGAALSTYRPKIIFPAVVCSTLVTTMSMLLLIILRALSTTTIVPSSRYATPWLYSLPSFRMKTFMISPGSTTGLSELASSLMLRTSTPRSCATLFRLKSLVTIFPWSVRAELDQLEVDFPDLGKIDVRDHHVDARHLLDLLQDVEAAPAAVALQRVGGVGDELQLLEHELRDDERAVDEAGLADVGDAAVDDDAGVENLVALLRAGGAEQRDQPRRLEPFALARRRARGRDTGSTSRMKLWRNSTRRSLAVGPEQRRADGLARGRGRRRSRSARRAGRVTSAVRSRVSTHDDQRRRARRRRRD